MNIKISRYLQNRLADFDVMLQGDALGLLHRNMQFLLLSAAAVAEGIADSCCSVLFQFKSDVGYDCPVLIKSVWVCFINDQGFCPPPFFHLSARSTSMRPHIFLLVQRVYRSSSFDENRLPWHAATDRPDGRGCGERVNCRRPPARRRRRRVCASVS